MSEVALREVRDADLACFREHLEDPVAARMAAFVAADAAEPAIFRGKWEKIRKDPGVTVRTILWEGRVAGHIASFPMEGELEVTYWVDRELWGRQIATRALRAFLALMTERPVRGRAAADNVASIRVLEKNGFRRIGAARGHAPVRGEEVDELILMLADV